ncbi:acyltransferase [Planctomonas sp. JC2975]|uniref:acyltransferase family protein n=1 Tax=Planctomonas sp. JC2975 TaxID=2729626 RepID=UPI0014747D7B|nr:acyltransferase [Planctomonas sp. JC2975]
MSVDIPIAAQPADPRDEQHRVRNSRTWEAPPAPLASVPASVRVRARDGAVDLARAWCLTVVVVMHALMVGVTMGAGGPVLENALEGWSGFAPFTWFAQIMPLFFVLGGFSAHVQFTSLNSRGVTASGYIALRMRRLLRPALAAIAAIVLVLAVLTLLGTPADIVAIAGFRLSQPLWFLGVYALTTAAVPLALAAHRRAPWASVGALAGLAATVDIVRSATGMAGIGFLNLVFVWLLVQQFGFWLAEDRMPRSRLAVAALAVAAYGSLALLCTFGVFSFDLLYDLNPPCFALVLLGIGQLALFRLFAPALRRMHALRPVNAIAGWINARAMTVYLWHMLVLVLLAGVLVLVASGVGILGGAELPALRSGEWWATRPLWLVCVIAAVALVVTATSRWETAPAAPADPKRPVGWGAASASALLAIAGVVVILVTGFTIVGGVVGLACIAAGLRLASGQPIVGSRVASEQPAGGVLPSLACSASTRPAQPATE